jgi:outer membrane usher protein
MSGGSILRRFLSLYSLAIFLLCTLATNLAAEEELLAGDDLPIIESSAEQEISLGLVLDKKRLGEVLAIVTKDGHLAKVLASDLIDALGKENAPYVLGDIDQFEDHNGWVSVEKLSYYTPHVDLERFVMILHTPAQEKPKEILDFNKQNFFIPENAIKPLPNSAYLNFRNNYSYSDKVHHYLLDADGAIRLDPWVLEGRFDVDSNREDLFGYQDLRFIHDDPDRCRRLTIGEDQAFRPLLLSTDRIHGIKYSTDHNLKPNLITDPISEFSFFLERDSVVEVWVNGEERDLLKLESGSYDVRNLALTTGFNEIILRIRDDLGNQETLTFAAVSGPNLLCPGIEQFDLSAGTIGRADEYSNDPVFSIFYRRGITDWFTLETEGRLAKEVQGIGVGGTYTNRFCYGEFNIADSFNTEGSGAALRTIVSRELWKYHLSFRYDYQQKKFLNQFQALIDSRLHHSERLTLNGPMIGIGGNIMAQFINSENWHGAPVRKFEVNWYYNFLNNWRITLTAVESKYDHPRSEFKGVLTYSTNGDDYNRLHTLRYRNDLKSLRTTINGTPGHGWPADWKFTHYHDIHKGGDQTDSINTTFDYLNNRFATNYSGWVDEIGNKNQFQHNITVASAIAYCGGSWGITRPIRDSFAIVEEKISDLDTDLTISKGGSREEWRSTHLMPGVVSDLRSYHPTRLYLDTELASVDMGSHDIVVYPAYRSGTVIKIGDEANELGSLVLRGTLIDFEGKSLENKAMRILNQTNPENEMLISFTNATGQFVIAGASKGNKYIIQIFGMEELQYEFVAPDERPRDEMIPLGILSPLNR